MGAKDTNGVIASYGTGAVRHDHSKNFRDDGKRFDFSINSSSQYVSCEIYGYFALSNPPDDEVSGKMGGGRHSGSSDSRCFDMGIDCRNGDTRYRIESPHNDYSSGVSGGKGVGMSSNFIGYKFVKRNMGSGSATKVSIEIWQDTGNNQSTPSNQWKKVASWTLGDPNFASSSPPFYTPPSDHQETIRIDGPGGNPNLQYKWIGLREILPTDVEGGAVPGGGTTTPPPTGGTPPVIDKGVDLGTIPFVALDLNGDGVVEGYDGNRDGRTDGFDTNGDGVIDAIDVYGTGRANAFDTDGDGITDAYDTNGDGVIDKRGGGPGLNTSGPGGINSPDGSSAPPAVIYVTKQLQVLWAIDSINIDACSSSSPFETKDFQEIFKADGDNLWSDSLNYRKTGIAVQTATVAGKEQKSVFIGKRIRKVQIFMKKFGLSTITGLIYCRIRSANGTIVEEFQNTVDASSIDNDGDDYTFTHTAPQHDIEKNDIIYIEYPDGGDPNNYLRIKLAASDKADGSLSCLATDDGANTIKNIDKDLAAIVYI